MLEYVMFSCRLERQVHTSSELEACITNERINWSTLKLANTVGEGSEIENDMFYALQKQNWHLN